MVIYPMVDAITVLKEQHKLVICVYLQLFGRASAIEGLKRLVIN
jgi:hypothetical protein